MEGKKRKKSEKQGDTADSGPDSSMVPEEGFLAEGGCAGESHAKGLKKRKRSREGERDGEKDQESMPSRKKSRGPGDKEDKHDGLGGERTKDEVISDGKVDTSEVEPTPVKEKKGKKSRGEREGEIIGYVHKSDLEAEIVRDQVVVPEHFDVGVSEIWKKKGEKCSRDGEVEVPRNNDALDVDWTRVQSVLQVGVNDSGMETLAVKKKKGKKSRENKGTEFVGLVNLGNYDGDGVKDRAVVQDVDDFEEEFLPTKKDKGKNSRRSKQVAGGVPCGNSDLDGDRIRERAVVQNYVNNSDAQSLPTKKKKRKESRVNRDLEAEGSRDSISSDGDRISDQAVVGNNEYGLEPSPVRKKKAKKSRRDKETGHEGHLVSGDSDSEKVQNQVVFQTGFVETDVGSFPSKKAKKIVRFQEPEVHWREEEEDEEHQAEDDAGLEEYEVKDQDTSSVVPDGEVLSDEPFTEKRGWIADMGRRDLKYGYFTKEEDEKLRTAVYDYIKAKNWGEVEGLDMLLHCRSHSEARGAWVEIARCLPRRPVKLINSRAQRLLSRLKRGTWSQEELETLKQLQAQYGHDWKAVESVMGRPAQLIKDKWRVLRLAPFLKKGKWNEEELERLCMYVRWSLKLKEQLGKKEKDGRMLRDDINWEVIAEKMGRTSGGCSDVWYERLASSLVSEGNWANGDDRRLLRSLMESGASSEEAVDWDELLDDRDGLTCERRWYQMARLLSERRAPFEDKLEQLAKRYAPDLIGIEEDYFAVNTRLAQ